MISAPHTDPTPRTAHQVIRPGWRFLQPDLGDFLGGMHVVRQVAGTLLKVLDLPADWLNGLLNLRGVHWKFFRKAHRSSIKRVTQQPDQTHASEHDAGRSHTARKMQFLQYDYHGVKQDREKSRQDDRDANRARVVAEHREQARHQYQEQNRDSAKQSIGRRGRRRNCDFHNAPLTFVGSGLIRNLIGHTFSSRCRRLEIGLGV
jgi:hypothetical protein